ncbi:MAG: hypothetical protein JWQ91_3169, partial [Aeromicrobium sp.]|nr:hypothetical protein [Aeromicrobium sp.]
ARDLPGLRAADVEGVSDMRLGIVGTHGGLADLERVTKALNRLISVYKVSAQLM